ncbi:MAG: LptE family protein [Desulfobacterales bacterium]|nr:MAG: LptE family protein [Desulfobacterales bacterium]
MVKTKSIFWVLGITFLFQACGYRFPGGAELPGGAKRVFITIFDNQTSETGIETLFTNDLVFEFTRRRKKAWAKDLEDADAVLSGVIAGVSIDTISVRGKYTAAERRISIGLDLKLTDQAGNLVWAANGVSDQEEYSVVADRQQTEQNKQAAIRIISGRLAERIYNRLTDDF